MNATLPTKARCPTRLHILANSSLESLTTNNKLTLIVLGGRGRGEVEPCLCFDLLLGKSNLFNFELKLCVFIKIQAVSNTDTYFIKAVLWCEQENFSQIFLSHGSTPPPPPQTPNTRCTPNPLWVLPFTKKNVPTFCCRCPKKSNNLVLAPLRTLLGLIVRTK